MPPLGIFPVLHQQQQDMEAEKHVNKNDLMDEDDFTLKDLAIMSGYGIIFCGAAGALAGAVQKAKHSPIVYATSSSKPVLPHPLWMHGAAAATYITANRVILVNTDRRDQYTAAVSGSIASLVYTVRSRSPTRIAAGAILLGGMMCLNSSALTYFESQIRS